MKKNCKNTTSVLKRRQTIYQKSLVRMVKEIIVLRGDKDDIILPREFFEIIGVDLPKTKFKGLLYGKKIKVC